MATNIEVKKTYVIHCETGCTCCNSENHYRGFYNDLDSARRRIESYFNSGFYPLSSQYYRRGRYSIKEMTIEPISNNRFILANSIVLNSFKTVEIDKYGTIISDEIGSVGDEISDDNETIEYSINKLIAELSSENYKYYGISADGRLGNIKVTVESLKK